MKSRKLTVLIAAALVATSGRFAGASVAPEYLENAGQPIETVVNPPGEACDRILQADLVESDFINALHEAETDYRIHMLTKTVDGQKKYIVLMSPTLKAANSTVTRPPARLLSHFSHVGVVEQNWGDRFVAGTQKARWHSVVQWLSRIYGQYRQKGIPHARDLVSSSKPGIKVLNLDSQHQPSTIEFGDAIGTYIVWMGLGLFYAISGHIPHGYFLPIDSMFTFVSFYRSSSRLMITSPKFRMNAWYRHFFPVGMSVLKGRNATIAGNIVQPLVGRENASDMLAIVGPNQIDGIIERLEDAGWSAANRSDVELNHR